MRILFTNTGSWGTGAGTVIEGVSRELIKAGHSVKIIFPDAGIPSPDSDHYYGDPDLYHIIRFPRTHDGITFETFPLMIPDPNPRSPNAPTYRDLSDGELNAFTDLIRSEFESVIKDFRPDLVESAHVWLMGYVFSELGIPYVISAHNSDQIGYGYDERMRAYALHCARRARYIFSISRSGVDGIASLYKIPRDNVVFIPNGYDESLFRPISGNRKEIFAANGIDADPTLPLVTFVGKLSKTKGFDTLLQANALLQKELPYTLIVFGSGSVQEVFEKAPSEELMRGVYIIGHKPPTTVAAFNQVADLSVLPSRSEGFGIAALEAMGCAVPVVATSVGQMREFVVGEIVQPDNAGDLARAMKRILTLPKKDYQALSSRALHVAQSYSWQNIVEKRMVYYERALSKHPS